MVIQTSHGSTYHEIINHHHTKIKTYQMKFNNVLDVVSYKGGARGAKGTKRMSGGGIGAAKKGKTETGQGSEEPFLQHWYNTRINADYHILVPKYQSERFTLCAPSSANVIR